MHINDVASKGRSMAAWVLGAFRTRDRTAMLILYNALVRSHLEYCCILWNPQAVDLIQKIEAVQRAFTRKISGLEHLDYWERLRALGMMSLQRRRERYIIIHMWKILYGKCTNDVHIEFSPLSRRGITAKIPKLSKLSS